MLHADGDLSGMVAWVLDPGRHDWMRAVTGGDGDALAEIATTIDAVAADAVPDLVALCRLAMRRDALVQRNAGLPTDLPAVWAALSEIARAEALAYSVGDPGRRARVLVGLVKAIAAQRDYDRATRLAETIPPSPYVDLGQRAMRAVVESAAAAGDRTVASAMADRLHDPYQRATALVAIAGSAISAGHTADALALMSEAAGLAAHIVDPAFQLFVLGDLADLAVQAGDHERAEDLVRAIADPDCRVRAMARLAKDLIAGGQTVVGLRLAGEASGQLPAMAWKLWEDGATADLAAALTTAGHDARVDLIVTAAASPAVQALAAVAAARAAHAAGRTDRATAMVEHAVVAAASEGDAYEQANALTAVAVWIAEQGDLDRAEELARTITHPGHRAEVLTRLATVAAEVDHARAGQLIDEAEHQAMNVTGASARVDAITAIAGAAITIGDHNRARRLADRAAAAAARTVTGQYPPHHVRLRLARSVALIGDHRRADALRAGIPAHVVRAFNQNPVRVVPPDIVAAVDSGDLVRAADLATALSAFDGQLSALDHVAMAAARSGDLDRAVALADAIDEPTSRAQALGRVAATATTTGDDGRAETIIAAITSVFRPEAQLAQATATATTGDHAMAEAIARSISDPGVRTRALASVAAHADPDLAAALVVDVIREGDWTDVLDVIARMAPEHVAVLTDDVLTMLDSQ